MPDELVEVYDVPQVRAVGIYYYPYDAVSRVRILTTWIELLATRYPEYQNDYIQRRNLKLKERIPIIEINFLYRDSCYSITTYFPGQNAEQRIFHIDDSIPILPLPIEVETAFDFSAPYEKTFNEMYYGDDVDYT